MASSELEKVKTASKKVRQSGSRGVAAQLDADGAQDQQPEHDHQRQIEAAEGRGVEQGEGEEERASGGQQPDLVAVPEGADGTHGLLAFLFAAGDEEIDDADADVEAVEDDVGDQHDGDNPEPKSSHRISPMRVLLPWAGPSCATACGPS